MRCACKCDAIGQVQALRRSCHRSPETENEALPNRMAHVGKVIDAGANDYNRFYTPTSLDGDGPRRRRTSDRDTQSALISPSARRRHWPAVTLMVCELALYQDVARGDQNSCHSGYCDRELETVAAADPTRRGHLKRPLLDRRHLVDWNDTLEIGTWRSSGWTT